jgi:DNA replication and repair protein RecF
MNVTKVVLTSFRNYASQVVEFCPSLNVIEGENTAGKTNLVEAVYLCGVGKSPRAGKDQEMIRMGDKEAHITLFVDKKHRSHRVDIHLMKGGKKISIDGVAISKMSDLMGVVGVVFFAPDELRIVKADPAERRRFMNISLCQQSKPYYAALSRYNRILDNRNHLLKEAGSAEELAHILPDWNVQLAEEGAKIILARQSFLTTLQGIADPIHRAIAGENSDLSLIYNRRDVTDYDAVYQYLLEHLSGNYDKELSLGYTLCGPHRDDFGIMCQKTDLRTYGSQGQQRTAALTLKLAEISYFEQNTGEKPILLLDDVLSELDASRRSALIKATDGIQTLLTCTEFTEDASFIGKQIKVHKGTIE